MDESQPADYTLNYIQLPPQDKPSVFENDIDFFSAHPDMKAKIIEEEKGKRKGLHTFQILLIVLVAFIVVVGAATLAIVLLMSDSNDDNESVPTRTTVRADVSADVVLDMTYDTSMRNLESPAALVLRADICDSMIKTYALLHIVLESCRISNIREGSVVFSLFGSVIMREYGYGEDAFMPNMDDIGIDAMIDYAEKMGTLESDLSVLEVRNPVVTVTSVSVSVRNEQGEYVEPTCGHGCGRNMVCKTTGCECLPRHIKQENGFGCKRADVCQAAKGGNVCLNGGSCVSHDDGYLCLCQTGFTGEKCQTYKQTCGRRADGGRKWPWHAVLYHKLKPKCSATVINQCTLVTPAHCVVDDPSPYMHSVRLGSDHMADTHDGIIGSVKQIIIHPAYHVHTYHHKPDYTFSFSSWSSHFGWSSYSGHKWSSFINGYFGPNCPSWSSYHFGQSSWYRNNFYGQSSYSYHKWNYDYPRMSSWSSYSYPGSQSSGSWFSHTHQSDIAVIKLWRPIAYSDIIQPVCLPDEEDIPTQDTHECYQTGWGNNSEWLSDHVSRKSSNCRFITEQDKDSVFCAEKTTTETYCDGEGGPYVCRLKSGDVWSMHGIRSWGDSKCYKSLGYYMNIPYFKEWIDDHSHCK